MTAIPKGLLLDGTDVEAIERLLREHGEAPSGIGYQAYWAGMRAGIERAALACEQVAPSQIGVAGGLQLKLARDPAVYAAACRALAKP